MQSYTGFTQGQAVDLVDSGEILARGTIIRTGSAHACVTFDDGQTYDVPYDMLRQAGQVRTAAKEVLREEEQDGRVFQLVKEESNKDGRLAMQFKVFMGDQVISESEELVTNVYDQENGWSAPDDFDENKVDLIKSTYESGFDLLVDSYANIEQSITNVQAEQAEADAVPAEPAGEPAFAPGASPAPEGGAGGDAGGGEAGEGAMPEEGGDAAGGPEAAAAPAGEPAEAPEPAGEATAASLERRSFARSVLSARDTDAAIEVRADDLLFQISQLGGGVYDRSPIGRDGLVALHKGTRKVWEGPKEQMASYLTDMLNSIKKYRLGSRKHGSAELLRNPQHRINPILRQEMDRRGIDSASTNDLELADSLKNFDFGTPDKH